MTVGPDLTYNGLRDVFVAKVNAAGTDLDYCGYIGGSGVDEGRGIAVDAAGNAYVTGVPGSTEASFPVTVGPDLTFNGGYGDAFVAKVNAAGTDLDYCGYIGGVGEDIPAGIAVDAAGNAYVAGYDLLHRSDLPGDSRPRPHLQQCGYVFDAFVAKVNADRHRTGLLRLHRRIEETTRDSASRSTRPAAPTSRETLASNEASFPVTVGPDVSHNGYDDDAFVAKVNATGTALDYCGYIGGSSYDWAAGSPSTSPATPTSPA